MNPLEQALVNIEIDRVADRSRAINRTPVAAAIDRSGITVDPTNGAVLGVEDAIRALQVRNPELFNLTAGKPHDPAMTDATETQATAQLTGGKTAPTGTVAQRMDAAIRSKVGQ